METKMRPQIFEVNATWENILVAFTLKKIEPSDIIEV